MRATWVTTVFLLVVLTVVLVVSAVCAAEQAGGARVFRMPDAPADARLGDVWVSPKDGAEMVYVPAGDFVMGSTNAEIAALLKAEPRLKAGSFANEQPQFRSHLPGYWIDKCEVTVAQYRRFCRETGREMPEAPKWGWQDDHPIVDVTWHDAAAYAKWAGKRLPTEMEWEKAGRGTDGRIYPWGNQWPPPPQSGNFADEALTRTDPDEARRLSGLGFPPLSGYDDGYARTAPVGRFAAGASPYGARDMAGNVWEWCADWYDTDAYKRYARGDLTAPSAGGLRVLRGGSWSIGDSMTCRCVHRFQGFPGGGNYFGICFGFRCVRGAG